MLVLFKFIFAKFYVVVSGEKVEFMKEVMTAGGGQFGHLQ